jgi:hypothetical protein
MEYFNINAFYLGVLFFACQFLSNVIYSLICLIWKIKIVEFSLFANFWYVLHKEKILGTEFILGWLPTGSHIKPLGMFTNKEERAKINPSDLPYAFFNKPKYLQKVFRFVPWTIYLGAALISILIISTSSFASEISSISNYIIEAISTMFSDSIQVREDFIKITSLIVNSKNIVIFAFAILLIIMMLLKPTSLIMNWFSANVKKNKLQKALGFRVPLVIIWFIIWKLPRFIFSFFSFSQSLVYFGSFLVGMFSVGLVCFFTTLFVVKNTSQNLNDNKVKWQEKL